MTAIEHEDLLDHLYQVLYGDIRYCGCGYPAQATVLVHELLTAFSWGLEGDAWDRKEAVIRRLLPSPGVQHLVLSMLTAASLTEHGTSIHGSWLTPRGKWFLWAVATVGGADGLDEQLDAAGFPHDGETECTAACWQIPDGWAPPALAPEQPAPPPGPCVRCLYGTPHQHEESR